MADKIKNLLFTGETVFNPEARQGMGEEQALFVKVIEGQEARADSLMKAFRVAAAPHERGGIMRLGPSEIAHYVDIFKKDPMKAEMVANLEKGSHALAHPEKARHHYGPRASGASPS